MREEWRQISGRIARYTVAGSADVAVQLELRGRRGV